jgi:hypothetical protein
VQETALVAVEGLEDRIRGLMGDGYRAGANFKAGKLRARPRLSLVERPGFFVLASVGVLSSNESIDGGGRDAATLVVSRPPCVASALTRAKAPAAKRRWAMEELAAAMVAKRAATAALSNSSRSHGGRETEETKTHAEKLQEARKDAEAIRVANGGAPAQVRAARAPVPAAPAPVATYDKQRDDLMLLVISQAAPALDGRLERGQRAYRRPDSALARPYPLRTLGVGCQQA